MLSASSSGPLRLLSLTQAQTTCIAKALPHSTCADPTDFACLCADEPYITFSETCILSSCNVKQALSASSLEWSPLLSNSLTLKLASQAWQKKACRAPVRDTGPLLRRLGTGFIVIAFFLVFVRFFARWSLPNSSVGWDDWTILVAFLGLVPSTVIAQISEFQASSGFMATLIR